MAAGIEFRGVTVESPGRRAGAETRPILDGVSLTVEAGRTTALLGRSGSGKTTLLRTVNRMVRPSGGQVLVGGRDVAAVEFPAPELIRLRRGIGYVIQETGLFPHFSVERNVALVPEISGQPQRERVARAHALLAAVGLDPQEFARRFPRELSGGQRQRVGLARALASEPELLLMDEPFGALDPMTRAEMQDLVKRVVQPLGRTILLVTHDLDEALYLADRVVLLEAGRVVAALGPAEFLRSGEPAVRAYVEAFHRGERAAAGKEAGA